ncbi:FtsX-like permease family protein [Streptomyces sp. NPDC060194]|uniref:FtsX-like permease family protein n=1 Tax=Streptomyces sp. NPDC060194 TaxID=3347069 RepID=UPI00365ED7D7
MPSLLTLVWAGLRTRWVTLAGSFVALSLGVGLVAATGLGLAATADGPAPATALRDTLQVRVERGPGAAYVTRPLAHPQPVDRVSTAGKAGRDGVAGPADGTEHDGGGPGGPGDRSTPGAGVKAHDRDALAAAHRAAGSSVERLPYGTGGDGEAVLAVQATLGTAGGVTAFVAAFVVASTFAFAVALRRREFALLRLAGATAGQVRRTVTAEAAVVGALAAAAGCGLGALGAPELARLLVDGGIAPRWFAITGAHTWPYHLAFWTGLSVSLLASYAAARRAGRTGAAEAMREASLDRGVLPVARLVVGTALLLGAAALIAYTLATDPDELLKRKTYTTRPMLLITGAALLTPLLVRPLTRLLRLPGAVGTLVRENTAAAVRRTSAVAAPVLVTVALAGSMLGTADSVADAKAAEARQQLAPSHLVVTGDDLRPVDVPGAVLSPSASTVVLTREEGTALVRTEARAVTSPAALAATRALPVVAGDVRDLDDSSIVVNEEWQRHTVGDHVDVWLGDGRPVRLRIAAVLALGTGDNGAYVTRANVPTAAVDRIDVRVGDASSTRAAAALAATGGKVRTVPDLLADTRPASAPHTRLGFWLVLGIALLYTVISLANTLVMAESVRGPELRALRLAGATRSQIRRVLAGEALLSVTLGATLGLAVTAANLGTLALALRAITAPAVVGVPWGAVAVAAGVCGVVAAGVAAASRE